MNLSIVSAEIARRIPEMAKDSVTNNEGVILRILEEEHNRSVLQVIEDEIDKHHCCSNPIFYRNIAGLKCVSCGKFVY